jgi:hypothetical protein
MGETFSLVSLVRVAGDGASPACDLDCDACPVQGIFVFCTVDAFYDKIRNAAYNYSESWRSRD